MYISLTIFKNVGYFLYTVPFTLFSGRFLREIKYRPTSFGTFSEGL